MTEFNENLGAKVRSARLCCGWSQDDLGKAINLTFQQVQKYENGKNRISVEKLTEICEVLGLSIVELLDDTENLQLLVDRRDAQMLVYSRKIKCKKTKTALMGMAKVLGEERA